MKTFFSTRIKSFKYAFSGVHFVLTTQKNAWIHLFFTVAVIFAGIWLRLNTLEWALIVFCIALVWVTECINTSIEAFVDLVSPNQHPLARVSKDAGAAAVLIAAIASVVIGLLVLGPPLYRLLFVSAR